MLGDIFKLRKDLVLNNLKYCAVHARDICHECSRVCATENEKRGFKLQENGNTQYPEVLSIRRDPKIRSKIGKRWLDMQKILYPGLSEPMTASVIKLPMNENSDGVTVTGIYLQKKLLQVFHQLQGLTATQRYYYGNQSRIMIEDYDTFMEAAVLYEEELADMTARMLQIFDLTGSEPGSKEREAQAKSSILNKFAFFLELNTYRTFWRTMEMTADAFVMHTEHYHEEADGEVIFTEKARIFLLQWLAHSFWSVQHAQFRLNRLRALQHEVYQRNEFPHYPVVLSALEADLDVHVIIAKLSKASLHDMPSFASLLMELREASEFNEQMKFVNAEIMAAIDELSARFRVLENLILAAQCVASLEDIKTALMTYKFLPDGRDVNSRVDDVTAIIFMVPEIDLRKPTPKKCSHLHKLIVKENTFRQTHAVRFMRSPFTKMKYKFTKKMFDEFKELYTFLYREYLRKQWREDEYSLLPMDVARRRQHRLDVQKKKKKKRLPVADPTNYEQADMAEVRAVPESAFADPYLLWEFGNGIGEKYVPPVIREKVKTRKQVMNIDDSVVAGDKSVQNQVSENIGVTIQRPLYQLKKSDVITRDLLWHRAKGTLKWSDLVQFLTRLGCHLLPQDGSKRKIIDPLTRRWTLLHRPHPGDECRPDQRESYRIHIEDWLNIKYSDLTVLDDTWETK